MRSPTSSLPIEAQRLRYIIYKAGQVKTYFNRSRKNETLSSCKFIKNNNSSRVITQKVAQKCAIGKVRYCTVSRELLY